QPPSGARPARTGATMTTTAKLCRISKESCYYTYQAPPVVDRDGAPCTYGPYKCGSSFPDNLTETPFCSDTIADNYGCGALAYQVANVTDCPRQPNTRGVPLEHICNATNNVAGCSLSTIPPSVYTSVVTDCSYPNLKNQPKRCIIDSYIDPGTGHKISV